MGKTGKPFTDKHSYFQTDKPTRQAIRTNVEAMKEYSPYNRMIELEENKIFINDFADMDDLAQNLAAARKLATSLGKDIYIRPHININGYKNPELGIGKVSAKGDLKTFNKGGFLSFLRNRIKATNKQGASVAVLDISEQDDLKDLNSCLLGSLSKRNTGIQKVIFIKENTVVQITRKQIEKKDFASLKALIKAKSDQ